MALQASGPISIDDIVAEFGGSSPDSLTEYYGAAAGVPSSGAISLTDFYGTSNFTPISASGGTVYTSGSYRYHRFTSSGTFTINSIASGSASNNLQVFAVGGGGGSTHHGGGGGGGGRCRNQNINATVGGKSVVIGSGGAAKNMVNFGATQGGNGSSTTFPGMSTASGGGGGYNRYMGTVSLRHRGGTSGTGNLGGNPLSNGSGWAVTGGGGHGAASPNGTYSLNNSGGTGYTLSGFTAAYSRTQYGGGGGGSWRAGDAFQGVGQGVYGGGRGATTYETENSNTNGATNSGGGGGSGHLARGGQGGSGLLIVKYQIA